MLIKYMRRTRIMMNEEQTKEDVMKAIRFRILQIEKKNAKSHEKKDADMVSEIVKIIQSEVDRTLEK